MFDSEVELLRHIQLGENSRLEFKEERFAGQRVSGPVRAVLADEFAIFEDIAGGVCAFGLTRNLREVVGVETERRTMMGRRGEGVLITRTRTKKLGGQNALLEVIDREGLRSTIPASFESGQW